MNQLENILQIPGTLSLSYSNNLLLQTMTTIVVQLVNKVYTVNIIQLESFTLILSLKEWT